jgi:C-terminal processing protease CtpA/Prc
VLHRDGTTPLGVRLGNAATADQGVPIVSVAKGGQGEGKLQVGDQVVAINGNSVLGFTMQEAAVFVMRSKMLNLRFRRSAPSAPSALEQ